MLLTKTRAPEEFAGNCPREIPLTSWHVLEQTNIDRVIDRVFFLLRQQCAFGGGMRRLRGWNVAR
jgi:hypothetical protein